MRGGWPHLDAQKLRDVVLAGPQLGVDAADLAVLVAQHSVLLDQLGLRMCASV